MEENETEVKLTADEVDIDQNDGMDQYDYDDAILFAGKLINRVRKLILAVNDEIKETL